MKNILLLFLLSFLLHSCQQDNTPSINYDLDASHNIKQTRATIPLKDTSIQK